MSKEVISLCDGLKKDFPQLKFTFGSLLCDLNTPGPIRQEICKIKSILHAKRLLWESANSFGVDLAYAIPKRSSLEWKVEDITEVFKV